MIGRIVGWSLRSRGVVLAAAEVEQLITVPPEQDLLNGVAWLDTIRSESIPGLSRVELIFEPGTDLLRARQMVGLSSRELSPIELSVLARWTIRPRLMGVSGVANVAIWGQRERQLQVQADPEKLAEHGVTFNQVVESTGNALWVSPLTFLEASTPGTGGFIATPNQRLGIRHVLPITTPEDLARVTVDDAGPKPRGSGYDDFGAGSPRRW